MHTTTMEAGYGNGQVSFVRGSVLVAAAVVLKLLGEVVADGLGAAVKFVSFLQKPAMQRQPAMLGLHTHGEVAKIIKGWRSKLKGMSSEDGLGRR